MRPAGPSRRTAGDTSCPATSGGSTSAGAMRRGTGECCESTAGTSRIRVASSSPEAPADIGRGIAAAPRWGLPGTDGRVTPPWLALIVGRDGPLDLLEARGTVERDGSLVFDAAGASFSAHARWSAPDALR